ncbi:MAG: 60S ribosomal protein L22 [Candidatus Hodarchaeota archaeon]
MAKAELTPETQKTFLTVEIKDLLTHGSELGTALINFLTEKLKKDITVSLADNEVYVRSDRPNHPSKTQLRVYLKRFIHLNALREDLKIISRSKERFAIIEFVTVVYVEE